MAHKGRRVTAATPEWITDRGWRIIIERYEYLVRCWGNPHTAAPEISELFRAWGISSDVFQAKYKRWKREVA